MEKIRVLIVDDSRSYRQLLRQCLEKHGVEVVSEAPNGRLALPRVRHLQPDLVILDQEMPEMDGLETLKAIRSSWPDVGVIMFSSHTVEGARITLRALELGALDFVTKPVGLDPESYITDRLIPLIYALCDERLVPISSAERGPARLPVTHVVGVGVSTGGPVALRDLLIRLPGDLTTPILIVQHMPPVFTQQMAESLNQVCALKVCEARQDQVVGPGVFIAPGGMHMSVRRSGERVMIQIQDGDPELHCKPSVNVLFRSLASVYQEGALALIMTGMGEDGYEGIKEIRRRGGSAYAQSPESCLIFGMPARPVREGLVQGVGDIARLAGWVEKTGHQLIGK